MLRRSAAPSSVPVDVVISILMQREQVRSTGPGLYGAPFDRGV
jgi:hypothetical protein